jgi:receptor protein-tyrosine kinase
MTTESQRPEDTGGPLAFLRTLRRRILVVLACLVVVPGAAFVYSITQQKQYSASSALLFRDPQLDQKLFGSTVFSPSSDPAREAATNVKLVSLGTVAARTSRALHGELSPSQINSEISVSPDGQSDVASITATDPNPSVAAKLANTFAEQYINFRRDADRSKISSAQALVAAQLKSLTPAERNTAQGTALAQRSEQLRILAALQTGNAELVQPADIPTSPSSPRVFRNTALGVILGLILGVALAVLFERLDRRLRDTKEISDAFGRPILGAIPESRNFSRMATARLDELSAKDAEPVRMLRANLRYFNVDRQIRSVLITSASPGEGKSTIAMHLAQVAASTGERVLLVEADLRRPSLTARLGLSGSAGLSQVLAGTRRLEDAIERVHLQDDATSVRPPLRLDVLASGPIPPNPTDLIESDRMRDLLREVESQYNLVVIDTPPTSIVSDAIPLVARVSGVIVVARLGRTTRDAAHHLRNQLEHLDAHTLGVVVNAIGRQRSAGAYGYGGDYAYGGGYTSRRTPKKRRSEDTQSTNGVGAHAGQNGHAVSPDEVDDSDTTEVGRGAGRN